MRTRRLGRTGLEVGELGFGTWGIGNTSWIGADDDVSVAALKAAKDSGITFFDTALVYGRGHSEQLLARVFGKSKEIVLASKAPPKYMLWPAPSGRPLRDAYPREHVLECLERTLRNLGRETIDLYQFHVWSDEWADESEWKSTVEEIRRSGKARFIGISINDHQPENVLRALDTGLIDTVQTIYNVFDQSPADRLFPYCAEHDLGVIVRVPFDEGGLTGSVHAGSRFPEGDFRNRYFSGERKQQVQEHVQNIVADLKIDVAQMSDIALRFCLSHLDVSTVIAGMRRSHHVLLNAATANMGSLPPEILDKLRGHRWIRNFYAPPLEQPEKQNSILPRLRTLVRDSGNVLQKR